MTEDEGITINSNTNITLEAKGKILLAANENINLYAETGINMITNAGGSVRMDGTTRIFGRAIKDAKGVKGGQSPLKGVFLPATLMVRSNRKAVIRDEAKKLGISPEFLEAVIMTESSGSGYQDGKLIIRFEAHYFNRLTSHKYSGHFSYNTKKPWTEQKFRENICGEQWEWIHPTKNQQKQEYRVFDYARRLNEEMAYRSISMGLGQIMGENYQLLDYNSAKEMYDAFSKSEDEQIKGIIKFIKAKPNAYNALKQEDFGEFVKYYNGPGKVAEYTKKFENNLEIINSRK